MRVILPLLLLFIVSNSSWSQPKITRIEPTDSVPVVKTYWERENKLGFDFSQVIFMNWNAGGNSSFSGLLRGNFVRKYTKDNVLWNNEMLIRYGVNKQEGRELRKSDDAFVFNSNFGYKTDPNSNYYYSARFNFNTQFTNGYTYPNTDVAISKLFAPAYLFLGAGVEYNRKDKNFNVYFSPLTLKTTFVLNRRLADLGSFGVPKAVYDADGNLIKRGDMVRSEFGFLINSYWKKEVMTNMTLENRLSIYSDYINNFGNLDVDLSSQLEMKVNEFVRATIALHFIYDDDVKTKKNIEGIQVIKGPKLQLREMLAVGVVYAF